MFKLSQETIAIVTVGLALAGLILATTSGIRDEARADRDAFRSEVRALRAEARADRAEARADRDALRIEARADRDAFEKHVTRLTQGQSRLTGMVEQMRTAASANR